MMILIVVGLIIWNAALTYGCARWNVKHNENSDIRDENTIFIADSLISIGDSIIEIEKRLDKLENKVDE